MYFWPSISSVHVSNVSRVLTMFLYCKYKNNVVADINSFLPPWNPFVTKTYKIGVFALSRNCKNEIVWKGWWWIQITKRNAESILTALGFQVLEYNYVDNIGKDMVLDVLYEGEKILPGQKIPMNSALSLILGNGKR